ncbi:MAG: hypothetical protein HYZ09_01780 [Candidatus Kerfeldbacteria bacterium]|nr:hypothetical protein [Candidatus Kerfeldbacteria bacterium]
MRTHGSILAIVVLFFLLAGQACIRFSSPPPLGPTLLRSDNRGIDWVAKDFVEVVQDGKKTVTVSLTSWPSYDLRSSPANPGLLFLSTYTSGLFRSTTRGEQWDRTGFRGQVVAFALDPLDDERLFLTDGKGLFRSDDRGANWTTVFTITRGEEVLRTLEVDFFNPARIMAVSNLGAVYRTTDQGETWTNITQIADDPADLIFSPRDSRVAFLRGARQGLWRSRDGGSTWESLRTTFDAFPKAAEHVRITFAGPDRATIYAATGNGLLRSRDNGDTWERIPTLFQPPFRIGEVAVDPGNEAILSFAVSNKLHQSLDGGSSWTVYTIPTNRPLTYLRIDPNDSTVMYLGAEFPPEQ